MTSPSTRPRRTSRPGAALGAGLAALLLPWLTACDALDPIHWYHGVTGEAKDEPRPDARNTANLEAGSQQPYPNLATVPDLPEAGLTQSQRQALTSDLIARRGLAQSQDAQLRAGEPANPAGDGSPPVAAPGNAVLPGIGASKDGSPPLDAGSASPPEAAFQAPTPREAPEPQPVEAPPPPPVLAPVPPPEPPKPGGLIHVPMPASAAALPPVPRALPAAPMVPAAPALGVPAAPALGVPAVAGGAASSHKTRTTIAVARLRVAADSKSLPEGSRNAFERAVALYHAHGGLVRVRAYSGPGAVAADPAAAALSRYRTALDRAQVVKQGLVDAGIPDGAVITEVANDHAAGDDAVDIVVEY